MRQFSRRTFLQRAALLTGLTGCATRAFGEATPRPNVVLIITDDQGYGDLACHGNPHLKTPNLDRLYAESTRLTRFHVCPVCSPTRACLMTGRYNYRTGVVDTYQGRSMMHADEFTLAESLAGAGYRTGLFGKWHLGDNYPMRAVDQGFQESLVHKGGGICQPSEPRNNSYFDPILSHNGQDTPCKGYCTDLFTDAALRFIEENRQSPFFAYVAFNAPHEPLIVDERYSAPYLAMGLPEKTAKVYGMIANIDENVGRIMGALDKLDLSRNTILIFMTDNGAQHKDRFNAGLRGTKGTAYEGGIRVPFFIRWPDHFRPGLDIDRIAAHIDVFPTLTEICGGESRNKLDGASLLPLLKDPKTPWPDRTLFFQWHRGDEPKPFVNSAVLTQRYKLVEGKELYDLQTDPAEQTDIAAQDPGLVADLRARYEAWFRDVGSTRGYAPPRIHLGTPHENPTVLTRQDWRAAESWHDGNIGCWEVHVARGGAYEITATFPVQEKPGEVIFRLNGVEVRQALSANTALCTLTAPHIPEGDGRLEISTAAGGPESVSVRLR